MYASQLSSLMPLRYRHGFHSRLGNLGRPLRYFLGGIRPKQTTHQILFQSVFAVLVRTCLSKGWYCTDDSIPTGIETSKSPIYSTGSFRLTVGNRHLHRYCIFTERVPETVLWSLRHSCASELHCVISFYKEYQTISSSQRFLHFCFRIFSFSPWIHFKRKTHYFIQSVFFPVHISLHQETNLLE